jgi:uncharacterized membrane protein YgcG
MGLDHRGFASAVLALATKGRLRINEEGKTYTLEQQPGSRGEISPAEEALSLALFAEGPSLELKQANHKRLRVARQALRRGLEEEVGKGLFTRNHPWFLIGLVGAALLLLLVVFLAHSEADVRQELGGGMFTAVVAAAPLLFWLKALRSWWREGGVRLFLTMVVALLVFLTVEGFANMMALWSGLWPILVLGICAAALATILFIFYHLLPAPSAAGRKLLDQITGFRRYMEVAEEHRLGVLHPPERTPELFERYLPHALALGVEHEWSEKFADVLAKSAAEDQSPSWYSGRRWDSRSPDAFASRLGSSLSSAVASASSAPGSSSGSGGGGSSGGGGGGGGGSGW